MGAQAAAQTALRLDCQPSEVAWQASSFDRWRGALADYVPSAQSGAASAGWRDGRNAYAMYIQGMHNRIHPMFDLRFLCKLGELPAHNPLNDPAIYTKLEIVLDGRDGRIVKMGVLRSSGITAFDIGALDAVDRASPFGKAPESILSADGAVYVHWEFHRDPVFACSTINARPFVLKNVPSSPLAPAVPDAGTID